ncbi:MAG: hypothetical protein IPK82_18250 [Polyangiaceae bacterium]|nr:hypothetical protein [Polyangiaceae bacterium]
MRLRPFALVLAVSASVTLPVFAVPPDTQRKADEMFQMGRELMGRNEFRKALDVLRESQQIEPTRGKLLNIAVCEEHLGLVASALAHIREVDPQIPAGDDRRPIVDGYLKTLPPRIPHLQLLSSSVLPEGTQVLVDDTDVPLAKIGTDLPMDAGVHSVIVKAPGRSNAAFQLTLEEGKKTTFKIHEGVELGVQSSAATTKPAAETDAKEASPARSFVPAVALGVVGLAGIGAGIGFVAGREGQYNEAKQMNSSLISEGKYCNPSQSNFDPNGCSRLSNLTSTTDAFGTAAIVSFVVGALAGASAAVYLAWPSNGPQKQQAARVSAIPFVTVHEQGLSIQGYF